MDLSADVRGFEMQLRSESVLVLVSLACVACESPGPGPNPIRDTACDSVRSWTEVMWQSSQATLVGRTLPLVAIVGEQDVYGFSPRDLPLTWSSSDPTVLQITNDQAKALKAGTATVTAAACGKTKSLAVSVLERGYDVVPIGKAYTNALNDSGEVVGSALQGSTLPRYFLWKNGSVTDLGNCRPTSVNNRGQVGCGHAIWPSAPTQGPMIWENGAITSRDTLLHFDGIIDDSGHVAGARSTKGVLWLGPGLVDSTLGTCAPTTINRRSHVGGRTTTSLYWSPCRSIGSGVEYLRSIGGRYANVDALNDENAGAGSSEWSPTRGSIAVLWRATTRTPEALVATGPQPNNIATGATGINNRMEIVGGGNRGAFLWFDGKLALLSALVNDPRWTITFAEAINNAGQILATGISGADTLSVLLVPDR